MLLTTPTKRPTRPKVCKCGLDFGHAKACRTPMPPGEYEAKIASVTVDDKGQPRIAAVITAGRYKGKVVQS
jgi:hypothetical protein